MRLYSLYNFGNLKKSLIGASLAALLGTATGFALPTYAATPMVKTSAAGFYRVMLGDFEVTALSDGTVSLPVDQLLTNTTKEKTTDAFSQRLFNQYRQPLGPHRYRCSQSFWPYFRQVASQSQSGRISA
jgi:hypothetical protein